jgi:hypothetical protein
MLFDLPHENAGLEALHFHGEGTEFEIMAAAVVWVPAPTASRMEGDAV